MALSVSTKILLISFICFCLVSSAIIENGQSNGNNNDNQSNQNSNSNQNDPNQNGKKSGLDLTWEQYKTQFGKQYSNPQEQAYRRATFQKNKNDIANDDCQACGVSQFTDLSQSQFQALLGTFSSGGDKSTIKNYNNVDSLAASITPVKGLPTGFDWRNYSAVTLPKNQGQCGSCWAFSATGFLESELIRRGTADNSLDLAEQFMTKCDTTSYGCNGGYPFAAADFGLKNGLPFESTYPYNYNYNYANICTSPIIGRTFNDIVSSVGKYSSSKKASNTTIATYLLQRPLMLGVNANDWSGYAPSKSQVWSCKSSNSKGGINHAVLLVGYTSSYWIIKNSWGTNWGLGGYIYVTKSTSYNCGIGLYFGWLTNTLTPVV